MTHSSRPAHGLRRALAVAIATVAVALTCAASAGAVPITGFAYQGLGGYSELGQFYERALNLPHARAIVPYDVVDRPAEMQEKIAWVQGMQARGRQVLISFNYSGTTPPSVATYVAKVAAFRNQMAAAGANVPEYTAWNEPNHRPGPAPNANPGAVLAAQYFKQLNNLCQTAVGGQRCVVAAGDFHDPRLDDSSAFEAYVRAYKTELATSPLAVTPARWAIHPYRAIKYQDFSRVASWIGGDTGTAEVWLTETGAMYCEPRPTGAASGGGYTGPDGVPHTSETALAFQNTRAQTLKDALPGYARVTRTYYYTLGWPGGNQGSCDDADHVWDSALLGQGDIVRPAFTTLFGAAPTPPRPGVAAGAATDVRQRSATLNGVVNTYRFATSYRFEYGTDTSYGNSVPVPEGQLSAGPDAVDVRHAIAGLRPNTTYHYRLVATSQNGASTTADATFRTLKVPMPRPSAVVEPDGDRRVFYRAENGQLQEWRWNGSAWSRHEWGLAGAMGGNPSAVVTSDGVTEVFYRSPAGQMWRWRLDGDSWTHDGYGNAGSVTNDPSAVATPTGGAEVFYRMSTGQMGRWAFHRADWNHNGYGYQNTVAGSPSGVVLADGTYEVVYRTPEGQLGRWRFPGAGWQNTVYGHAGRVVGNPAAVATGGTSLQVFYRTSIGQLGRWWFDGASWNPSDWGYQGVVAGDPSVVRTSRGRLEVNYRTAQDQIGRFWFAGDDWQVSANGYQDQLTGDPATIVTRGDVVTTFYGGPNEDWFGYSYEAEGPSWNIARLQPAPAVTAGEATDVGLQQATLSGAVDPRGLRTRWTFQYGTTRAYGANAPLSDGDAGDGNGPVDVRAVAGDLLAGTTYHYRLVATSSMGTVYSEDRTFRTAPMARPSAVVTSDGGKRLFYRALNGQLQEWRWDGLAWSHHAWGYAGALAGNPSAVVTDDDVVEVFYRAADGGQLRRWRFDGASWTHDGYGHTGSVAADPSAVATGGENVEVFYRTSLGQLGRWWFNGASWNHNGYGYQGAVTGVPSAVVGPRGTIDVLYRTAESQMGRWTFFGDGWNHRGYGHAGSVTGNPSATVDGDGTVNALYRTSEAQLGRWTFFGDGWNHQGYGHAGSVAGDPAAIGVGGTAFEAYYRAADGQLARWWFDDTAWNPTSWGLIGSVAGDPAAIRLADGTLDVFYGRPDTGWAYHEFNGSTSSYHALGTAGPAFG